MQFDSDYFNNLFNSVSTTTENDTSNSQTTFGSTDVSNQSIGQTYQRPYETDDYTTNQNYTSQDSYNPTQTTLFADNVEQKQETAMSVPTIEKGAQVVNLIKKQARVRLEARMKMVLAVFSVIVACLLFITAFNFIQVKKIQSTFSDKQIEINNLQQSITNSKVTYTLVSDEEYVREWAESNSYVEKNDGNYAVISLDEVYEEPVTQEIESNWFNDVCEFLSRLFA